MESLAGGRGCPVVVVWEITNHPSPLKWQSPIATYSGNLSSSPKMDGVSTVPYPPVWAWLWPSNNLSNRSTVSWLGDVWLNGMGKDAIDTKKLWSLKIERKRSLSSTDPTEGCSLVDYGTWRELLCRESMLAKSSYQGVLLGGKQYSEPLECPPSIRSPTRRDTGTRCPVSMIALGRSKTVKFAARHTQNYDSLRANGCYGAEPVGRSNQSRPSHFG